MREPLLTLRPATPGDAAFLLLLYASTRDDLAGAGLAPEPLALLLRLQHEAQSRSYAAQFPGANHRIVLVDGVPSGRLLLARSEGSLFIVDVALLPARRGTGLGRRLLDGVLAEAAAERLPVRLTVLRTNPARRLYERMGFVETGGDALYVGMERLAGADSV